MKSTSNNFNDETFELKLNCWIVGDDYNKINHAKILSSEFVADLQNLIKMLASNRLSEVDGKKLSLWPGNFNPLNLKEEAEGLKNRNPLYPLANLGDVFGSGTDSSKVNVIIRVPGEYP